jgi:hypothetical protein
MIVRLSFQLRTPSIPERPSEPLVSANVESRNHVLFGDVAPHRERIASNPIENCYERPKISD